MRYPSSLARPAERRRGMILLIVLSMLTLFTVVAISFVFYADAEAQAAEAHRQSHVAVQPDVDTEVLAAYFLNQLIYPTDNIYSAMRGWDLSRSIYGYNPAVLNFTPYNGIGRDALRQPVTFNAGANTYDNFNLINYTRYDGTPNVVDPYLGLLRMPEWYGKQGDANHRYVGGANPPWTAYDTNSLFLAQVLADGTVLMPSFLRPWNGTGTGAASKYMSLRPHASWHPAFSSPDTEVLPGNLFLDVRNLDSGKTAMLTILGTPASNDSQWMDLGFPVMTAPNGRRYKALFAPLIVDLSNRLHLWAHGNRVAANAPYKHASNMGFGAPEVNLGAGLFATGDPQYAQKMNELMSLMDLRYGGAGALPMGSSTAFRNAPNGPPWYSTIDADGRHPTSGKSSEQFFTGFSTRSMSAVPVGNGGVMPVARISSTNPLPPDPTPGVFPWVIVPGMFLGIDTAPNDEIVQVISVDTAANPPTFTANFTKAHANGAVVAYYTSFPFPVSTAGQRYPNGWNNGFSGGGINDEVTNMPLGFDLMNPTAPNIRPLPMSNMEPILRYGGTNSPALQSEVFRLMPATLSNPRGRGTVTLWNTHLDRITASPVIPWNRNAIGVPGPYQYTASGYPRVAVQPIPPPNYAVPSTYPPNSDFTADWRSNLGTMLRVNVNRPLTDYPGQDASGIIDTSVAATLNQYNQAVADRQRLARDIYTALIRVTGAQDPNVVPGMVPATAEYKAARWLAQFAVNMVDYIDNDDYATPFQWDTSGATEWVFGTELPRLVINEVYGQRDNNAAGNGKGNPKGKAVGLLTQDINLWVELHNPFMATPAGNAYPRDGGVARLAIGSYSPYQLSFCVTNPALTTWMRDPANNLGDLDAGSAALASTVVNWVQTPANATTEQVLPAGGAVSGPAGSNQGYYVVGPPPNYSAATNPNIPTTYQSPALSLNLDNATVVNGVTVLLRRLACPHLPPQTNPAQPLYNPYITVDYLDGIPVGDRRLNNGNGMGNNATTSAYGRKHPYTAFYAAAGNTSQVVAQTGGAGNQPSNTFYALNNPATMPFTWLTHLDRPLVNQLELLHVSAFKPHELTQQFVTPAGQFRHLAPWADAATGLFRSLDLLGTPNAMRGNPRGGRWHGNVNLNTITEIEVFRAIADAQSATQPYAGFTQTDVDLAFNRLIASRQAGGPEGTPFRSFAAGDLTKTLLRSDVAGPVFYPPSLPTSSHRYAQTALLQKIFNNVTTTSNVFAVWWTVGYFEVVDETVRPARLGQEIGRSENKHIRHRFFAIVDRSGLEAFRLTSTNAVAAGPNGVMNVGSTSGTLNSGLAWNVQVGMLLEMQSPQGIPLEVVTVKAVTANTFTADFTANYPAGSFAILRGNPGPQLNYNPRRDTNVVLHMSVIQ